MNESDIKQGKRKKEKEKGDEFQSSFKTWIRTTAWAVLICFCLEQPAGAIGFAPAIPPITPPGLSINPVQLNPGLFNAAVAESVRHFLNPLINKPINQVQIKPGIIVEASDELRITKKELKELCNWLKQPETGTVPCSAYVLYNLLEAEGQEVRVEEISSLLILIDVLAGNIKPPITDYQPKRTIYNSLYALQKTAEYFDLPLYPIKLSAINYQQSTNLVPFIAHLNPVTGHHSPFANNGHFVLVTKIDEEKVHYFYDKGNTFLPREKFLERFTGFCLLRQLTKDSRVVNSSWAQKIIGARDDGWGYYDTGSTTTYDFTYDTAPTSTDVYLPAGTDLSRYDIMGSTSSSSIQPSYFNTQAFNVHIDNFNPSASGVMVDGAKFSHYPSQVVMQSYTPPGQKIGNAVGYVDLNWQGGEAPGFAGWLSHYKGESIDVAGRTVDIVDGGYNYQTNSYLNDRLSQHASNPNLKTAQDIKTQNLPNFPQGGVGSYRGFSVGEGYTGLNFAKPGDAAFFTSSGVEMRPGDNVYGHKSDSLSGIGADSKTRNDIFKIHPQVGAYQLQINPQGNISPIIATQIIPANTPTHTTEGTYTTSDSTQIKDTIVTRQLSTQAKVEWHGIAKKATPGILVGAKDKDIIRENVFIPGTEETVSIVKRVVGGSRSEVRVLDRARYEQYQQGEIKDIKECILSNYNTGGILEVSEAGEVKHQVSAYIPSRENMPLPLNKTIANIDELTIAPLNKDRFLSSSQEQESTKIKINNPFSQNNILETIVGNGIRGKLEVSSADVDRQGGRLEERMGYRNELRGGVRAGQYDSQADAVALDPSYINDRTIKEEMGHKVHSDNPGWRKEVYGGLKERVSPEGQKILAQELEYFTQEYSPEFQKEVRGRLNLLGGAIAKRDAQQFKAKEPRIHNSFKIDAQQPKAKEPGIHNPFKRSNPTLEKVGQSMNLLGQLYQGTVAAQQEWGQEELVTHLVAGEATGGNTQRPELDYLLASNPQVGEYIREKYEGVMDFAPRNSAFQGGRVELSSRVPSKNSTRGEIIKGERVNGEQWNLVNFDNLDFDRGKALFFEPGAEYRAPYASEKNPIFFQRGYTTEPYTLVTGGRIPGADTGAVAHNTIEGKPIPNLNDLTGVHIDPTSLNTGALGRISFTPEGEKVFDVLSIDIAKYYPERKINLAKLSDGGQTVTIADIQHAAAIDLGNSGISQLEETFETIGKLHPQDAYKQTKAKMVNIVSNSNQQSLNQNKINPQTDPGLYPQASETTMPVPVSISSFLYEHKEEDQRNVFTSQYGWTREKSTFLEAEKTSSDILGYSLGSQGYGYEEYFKEDDAINRYQHYGSLKMGWKVDQHFKDTSKSGSSLIYTFGFANSANEKLMSHQGGDYNVFLNKYSQQA